MKLMYLSLCVFQVSIYDQLDIVVIHKPAVGEWYQLFYFIHVFQRFVAMVMIWVTLYLGKQDFYVPLGMKLYS